jgi:hypothetical protein
MMIKKYINYVLWVCRLGVNENKLYVLRVKRNRGQSGSGLLGLRVILIFNHYRR